MIGEVSAADDWPLMRERALGLAAELSEAPPKGLDRGDRGARAFIEWLEDHNFTFLGYREYELVTEDDELRLNAVPTRASASSARRAARRARVRSTSFRRRCASSLEPHLPNLTKANSRSTVHRPAYLDYVGVALRRRGTGHGRALPRALHAHGLPVARSDIPILRRKVNTVLTRAAFPPDSHNEKALIEILERIRATSPSRRIPTSCTRPPSSCTSGSVSGCACSSGATASGALLVPRVRAARPLQHGEPAPNRGDSPRRDRRPEPRLHNPRLGVRAGSAALHGLHRARPAAERGHADRRADDGGGDTPRGPTTSSRR